VEAGCRLRGSSLNAGLLLLVFQRMTKQLWLSAFVAAVFAFHPLRCESVAWISERKDVLSTLLFMLGLLAYVRHIELPSRKHFAAVAACLLLGLMAKPMLVTFPFVLLLLDFWPLNRFGHDWPSLRLQFWPRVREKLPLFAIVLIVCVATYWAQARYGAVNQDIKPLSERISQVAGNYAFYVGKTFLPVGLNAIYPASMTPLGKAAIFSALFAAVTAAAVWRLFRQPWFAVGWFWFLGTLVPVVGFVRIGHISVAERYSYVPSVGLTVIVAWCIAAVARDGLSFQRIGTFIASLMVAACAVATHVDLPRWQDSLSLFGAAIKTDPHPVSYNNIAVCYLDRREYELAIEPLSRAIELDPRYVKAYINRITAYQKTGRFEDAKADLAQMVKVEPRNAEGYNSRADVLLDLERFDEAISDFTAAIKLSPEAANSYNNRATARFMKGDYGAAIEDCRKAIALNPNYANAFNNLGNIYARKDDLPRALETYAKAIALAPGDPITYNNRAAVYYRLKQYDRAWEDVENCARLGGTPHARLVESLREAMGTK
jgi:tetratricopeptide (TPR) repeat protein